VYDTSSRLQSVSAGLCATYVAGQPPAQEACTDNTNQKWVFRPSGAHYQVESVAAPGSCWRVRDYTGDQLWMDTCDTVESLYMDMALRVELVYYPPSPPSLPPSPPSPVPPGPATPAPTPPVTFTIRKATDTGLCLGVPQEYNGYSVVTMACQRWVLGEQLVPEGPADQPGHDPSLPGHSAG
jgi:hypothetical protein